MTTESFMDQIKAFGVRLGLPKVDVDKLVDIQLKNIDALGRSAQAAGEGAKALADKQREIVEAAFRKRRRWCAPSILREIRRPFSPNRRTTRKGRSSSRCRTHATSLS